MLERHLKGMLLETKIEDLFQQVLFHIRNQN